MKLPFDPSYFLQLSEEKAKKNEKKGLGTGDRERRKKIRMTKLEIRRELEDLKLGEVEGKFSWPITYVY